MPDIAAGPSRGTPSTRWRRAGAHRRHVTHRGLGWFFALSLLAVTGVLLVIGLTAPPLARHADRPALAGEPVAPTTAGASPTATTGSVAPTSTPSAPPLRLPGPVPSAGAGTFAYVPGQGQPVGRAGPLRRYRVAVERGSGEDVAAFGEAVESTLSAPESWTAGGNLRLQRVPEGAAHDFTVYLATAATARRMCLTGGVDIVVRGRPYTSCRVFGKVIINLDRWRLSVDHFVAAGVPLAVYRSYVINHEVGHELGHGHEACPGRGEPAPVMMQQTLFLDGCSANPWPYLKGRRYAGRAL